MSTAVAPVAEHAPSLNEPRREPLVLAFGGLLIVALTLAAALMLWRAREDSLDTWRLYMENFSATAAEHASQTLRSADYALGSIVDHVQALGVDSEARLREVARTRPVFDFIRERAAELPLLDVATIVALDGEVLNFSRSFPAPAINISDRDYHQAHLADPALTLYVSAPVKNRGTGRWTFYLARKIRSPSGQTLGLALAGIQSSYFERFYRSINLSEDDTAILLLRSDGTLLARHPPRPDALGMSYRDAPSMRALAAARAEGRSAATVTTVTTDAPRASDPSDTQRRMVTAHAVEDFPLAITITTREHLMLEQWHKTAWLCALGVLLLDAAIAAMTINMHVLLRRRRAALRQLDAARAAAEAAAAEKSRFLGNLSHEVRTPLHGLLGMAQRLLESPLQPAQRQQAQIIERTGRLLLGAVDEVLDFSNAATAAGQSALEPVPVDLARLGRDCIALFEGQARLKGVVLHLEVEDGGRGTLVNADPLRLSQVVSLLLSNAVKFTPAGSVTLRMAHTGAGLWRLSVHDTGIGLTQRQREALLEPHAPDGAEPAAGAAQAGHRSGLGLATVQRLVLLLGGTLNARGTPGQGSEFWCELPLESLEPPAPLPPPLPPKSVMQLMPQMADIGREKATGAANGISGGFNAGLSAKTDIEDLLDQRDGMRVVQ